VAILERSIVVLEQGKTTFKLDRQALFEISRRLAHHPKESVLENLGFLLALSRNRTKRRLWFKINQFSAAIALVLGSTWSRLLGKQGSFFFFFFVKKEGEKKKRSGEELLDVG